MAQSWRVRGGAIRGHKRWCLRGLGRVVGIPAATGTQSGERLVVSDQKLVAAPRLAYAMRDSWPIRGVCVGQFVGISMVCAGFVAIRTRPEQHLQSDWWY